MIEAGIKKILAKAQRTPDAVRFHAPRADGGWNQVTWGELAEGAAALARQLAASGIGPGGKVALFATTRIECAFAIHAFEAVRAVFVPVYFSSTAAQVSYVVNHAESEVLFTEMALLPKVLERIEDYAGVREIVVFDLERPEQLDPLLDAARIGDFAEVKSRIRPWREMVAAGRLLHRAEPERVDSMVSEIDGDDLAAIIYTSGTTGTPKGVMLTIDNLCATSESWHEALEHAFPPENDRRDILWLPVSHMAGWGILNQGTMFDYETWISDPYTILDIISEVRPTMLMSVPAYWEKMYSRAVASSESEAKQLAALRRIAGGALHFPLSGGAGLEQRVKDFFLKAGMHIIEGYGLTECSPTLTMNQRHDYDFSSVGKPVANVQIELAPDGEILAKGDNVFRGYFKNEEATAAAFDDNGWFKTGDLGAWTDRGFLQILGRKKEIIVTSGGKKIGPAGIEAQFVGLPLIEHVVLYGDEKKYLTAMVTLDPARLEAWALERGFAETSYAKLAALPETRALVAASVEQVNAGLASYETIKRFFISGQRLTVEAGYLTSSLKLRRKQVWTGFRPRFEELYQ